MTGASTARARPSSTKAGARRASCIQAARSSATPPRTGPAVRRLPEESVKGFARPHPVVAWQVHRCGVKRPHHVPCPNILGPLATRPHQYQHQHRGAADRSVDARRGACDQSIQRGLRKLLFWPGRKATVITGHALRGDQETKQTCPRIGKCAPSHRPTPSFEGMWGVWRGDQHERMK